MFSIVFGLREPETAQNELPESISGGPREPLYRMLQNECFGAFRSLEPETVPNELPESISGAPQESEGEQGMLKVSKHSKRRTQLQQNP